jgi:hypothetical protein
MAIDELNRDAFQSPAFAHIRDATAKIWLPQKTKASEHETPRDACTGRPKRFIL